jgi:hypothetical protein
MPLAGPRVRRFGATTMGRQWRHRPQRMSELGVYVPAPTCAMQLKIRGSPAARYAHSPMLGSSGPPMLDEKEPPTKRVDTSTGSTHVSASISQPNLGRECHENE